VTVGFRAFAFSAVAHLWLPKGCEGLAAEQPSGSVTIESTWVALGIGTQSGDGVLTLNDWRQFRFTVKGFQVGDLQVSKIRATGKVYRLTRLDWIPGTYTAGETGVTLGGGLSTAVLRNKHGVTIAL